MSPPPELYQSARMPVLFVELSDRYDARKVYDLPGVTGILGLIIKSRSPDEPVRSAFIEYCPDLAKSDERVRLTFAPAVEIHAPIPPSKFDSSDVSSSVPAILRTFHLTMSVFAADVRTLHREMSDLPAVARTFQMAIRSLPTGVSAKPLRTSHR
jgi:hypothetical protein